MGTLSNPSRLGSWIIYILFQDLKEASKL